MMDDLVERLITARDDDHERGCRMRFVVCSCGYDDQTARAVGDAKDRIEALQAALKAAETPLGDVAGLVNEARLDARAFREHNVYDSEGDPIRLTQNAARLDQYADAITALTRQLADARQHAEALAEVLDEAHGLIEQYCEFMCDEDFDPVIDRVRAALAAYRSVK